MGISREVLDFLYRNVSKAGIDLEEATMLELGNQRIRWPMKDGDWFFGWAKDFFRDVWGVDHTSVDINGKGGALVRNLSEPITDLGQFDIVTNFGTSEHVDNEGECWKNIDRFCKPGGVSLHAVPPWGNWPNHGYHRYSRRFFEGMALHAGYTIIDMRIKGKDNYKLLYAALKKDSK